MGGAFCMGVGGVTALGCTVGQGLSGLSTLSLTSAIAVVGIVLGAMAGVRFQLWLLERE
ncbi:putative transporter component [Hydrogenophaga sp. T4]|nr:putative transporter component [Hydrogenophaga sp. T4]